MENAIKVGDVVSMVFRNSLVSTTIRVDAIEQEDGTDVLSGPRVSRKVDGTWAPTGAGSLWTYAGRARKVSK